jgi:hypothetical protein
LFFAHVTPISQRRFGLDRASVEEQFHALVRDLATAAHTFW